MHRSLRARLVGGTDRVQVLRTAVNVVAMHRGPVDSEVFCAESRDPRRGEAIAQRAGRMALRRARQHASFSEQKAKH